MMLVTDQRGFTLIEMLVGMVMSLLVLGAAVMLLTSFVNDNSSSELRTTAQANAQTMIDRLSRELRNGAAPTAGSPGLLEKATAYDLVFQTVSAGPATLNLPLNQYRVRYCLDGSQTLWRQTETWSTATSPVVPDTSACPSTSSSWVTTSGGSPCCIESSNVTNEIGGDTTDPLFTFGPTGWTSVNQIKLVDVHLYIDVNPGEQPGPTDLESGIYLRNELTPPVANFTVTQLAVSQTARDVQLNGSASSDPNGQVLSYQWYSSGTCPSPTTSISGAVTQEYDAGNFSTGGNQTFSLVVTDTGGLTTCTSQTVSIQ